MSVSERRAARAALVADYTRQGWIAADIAAELGVTTRTVIRDRGLTGTAKPPPRWLTPDEVDRVDQLLADGCSNAEVERSLGRNPGTLSKRLLGRGWPPGMTQEFLSDLRRIRPLDKGSDIWGGWLTSESERIH